jgi:nicotinamidase-related amidase
MVDLQGDFWSQELAELYPHFPTNVAGLLEFARAEGLEIVHLRATFSPDRSDWMPVFKLRGHIPCIRGTPGAEPLPFALGRPEEKVLHKHSFDAFQNPVLLAYLKKRRTGFVLVAGLVTTVCVFLTAASAMQSGFLTAVVEDCCADHPEMHEQVLKMYRFIFERTTLGALPERHSEWVSALDKLDVA